MKRLVITFILASVVLFSCGGEGGGSVENNGASGHLDKKGWAAPAEYTEGDMSYSVILTDDVREIHLSVERRDGVSTASVTYPEELRGIVIVYDAMGVRMYTGEDKQEFFISNEASLGMTALLDILSTELDDTRRGEGGELRFSLSGVDIELHLNEDGYPEKAELSWLGYTRKAVFSFYDLKGD